MYGENRNRDRDNRKSFAPIRVGDEVDVTIEAKGEQGDGIAKVKGFVVFVPNTNEGDKVRIKITKVFRKVGFGEVIGESSGGETSSEVEEKTEEEETEEEETEELDEEE